MNESHTPKIFLIVFIIILALGGIVLAYIGLTGRAPEAPVKKQVAETDEFADWKTYRNEEFGFEIKYPAYGEVEESKEYVLIDLVTTKEGSRTGNFGEFRIDVFENELGLSSEGWVDKKIEENRFDPEALIFPASGGSALHPSGQFNGGVPSQKIRFSSFNQQREAVYISAGRYIFVLSYNAAGPNEYGHDYSRTFLRMGRNTFRILTDNVAYWNTYRNEKYGFEFKHPGDMILDSSVEDLKVADGVEAETALMTFGLHVFQNPNNFTPKEWYYAPDWLYEQACGINPFCLVDFGPPINEMNKEDVQGIKRDARTASYPNGFREIEFLGLPAVQYTLKKGGRVISDTVIFMKNSFIFSVGFGDQQIYDPDTFDASPKEVFDKILSTFKFIELINISD